MQHEEAQGDRGDRRGRKRRNDARRRQLRRVVRVARPGDRESSRAARRYAARRLTAVQAKQLLSGIAQRVTAFVNGSRPLGPPPGGPGRPLAPPT
jgi:hypothetical protein